jgi:hypothetical protein
MTVEHLQERLLEQKTAIYFSSCQELLLLVQEIEPPGVDDDELHRGRLPVEICDRIVQWLIVERIQMSHVSATGCSSISTSVWRDYRPSLSDCLTEDESTWWISKEPLRLRQQYVDFLCVPQSGCFHCVRIQEISIKVPPFEVGPYALRDFVVQSKNAEEQWNNISPQWTLEPRSGWQRFEWNDPVDVGNLRLLCLSNQGSVFPDHPARNNVVGFYSIRFD